MLYAFGRVRLDTGARRLSRSGHPVHLTRKAFELLVLLIEQRPNAVTKAEIYDRLWPDTFVTESSLQTLVHEIRQAIDASDRQTSWIRTVHGLGYNFEGEVAISESYAGAQPTGPPAAWLLVESRRLRLDAGENVIGRWPDASIEVDLPTISRRHVRIVIGDSATLEDLGSKNGTWLNGRRISSICALSDGDVVGLGSVELTFRLLPRGRSTESAEPPLTEGT